MKIELRSSTSTYTYTYSRGKVKSQLIRNIWRCVASLFQKKTTQAQPKMPPQLEILDPTHIEVLRFTTLKTKTV